MQGNGGLRPHRRRCTVSPTLAWTWRWKAMREPRRAMATPPSLRPELSIVPDLAPRVTGCPAPTSGRWNRRPPRGFGPAPSPSGLPPRRRNCQPWTPSPPLGSDFVRAGAGPAHLTGAVDGRPQFPIAGLRLPRRSGGGPALSEVLPALHDGRRNHPARPRARPGAGVAGLQAIGTAKRRARGSPPTTSVPHPPTRSRRWAARSSIWTPELPPPRQRRLCQGARSGPGQRQRALLAPHVAAADVLITTAAIPGRAAPLLVTTDMVAGMRAGSVVVDLAAESGGNVEGVSPGRTSRSRWRAGP